MQRSVRTATLCAIAALSTVLPVTPAASQTRRDLQEPVSLPPQPTQSTAKSPLVIVPRFPWGMSLPVNRQPMFFVEAIGFTAVDETGLDIAGSDEVYSTWSSGTSYVGTQVFGDIDSGNYRSYHELQSCIFPLAERSFINGRDGEGWRCLEDGAPGPISFYVNLYEDDDISFPVCFSPGIAPAPDCEDDWIGGYSNSWSAAELVAMLPTVGSSQDFTVRLNNCKPNYVCGVGLFDADYDFHFRIRRWADKELPMRMSMD